MSATLQRSAVHPSVAAFADEVGDSGSVWCVGGQTHLSAPTTAPAATSDATVERARIVSAPSGIISHDPDEMIVRVLTGTTVHVLDAALAERGQQCPIDAFDARTTIGGALAVGRSGHRRLRYGNVRDVLLEAHSVASDGQIVKCGAPVVKNVSGYDLARLLVGSFGTLAFLAEVVLRCAPRPAASRWFEVDGDAWDVRARAFRPSTVLWNGARTAVLFEGSDDEIAGEVSRLRGIGPIDEIAAPTIPRGARASVAPARLRATVAPLPVGSFAAEVGVGVVHLQDADPPGSLRRQPLPDRVAKLNRDIKRAYDPLGRLNPGAMPW
jgi:FAD/FMN-containing dehydrogenase